MMDFEAQGGNEFDNVDFAQAQGESPSPAAGAGARTVLMPDGQGVVVLPEGVTLQDIQAEGRDLVVLGADGTRYVIPDGGVTVPQIEVDGVAVPPANLAALLLGNQPEPAAGPPQSSGGNFADDVGPLQDAFGLGDLLPYTELQFPADEEDEVIPDIVDRRPDVSIEPGDSGLSVVSAEDMVDEAGLPARGGEPAGSDSAADSESTFGFINFSSPDGTSQVAINGVAVTQVGQTFSTPFGVLTITSIADGRIGYDYTLTDNTTDPAAQDLFTVTITDADGDTATATLRIGIVDDAPTAANDTDSVPAGSYATIGGNVITGAGTDSGAAGVDTPGADGARVSAVENSSGETVTGSDALVIQGTYGTLTLNADGSYSYQRAPGTPGGSTDTFTYTLTDGDGDTATATLTIGIGDAPATVISVPEVGDGTIVDESGLPEREDEAPGSAEPTDVETTAGTITFAAPDGVASVAINGVVITGAGQQIQLPEGTLTIVSYDPVGGTLEYSFTLADNTGGDATQVELTVTVTDTDGDSDSEDFVITVIDDTPTAVDDAAAQGAEGAPVVIDAFANDIPGADSVDLVSGVALVGGTLSGAGTVTYNNDGTFTYTPAQGEEGTVTFDYTITDGDGDTSTATVTITLAGDSVPTIDVIEAQGGALVHEAGLPAGSDAAADSETTTGTFAITTGNDALGSLVIDGVDVTSGGIVTGDYGTLTVTVSGGAYSYSYTLTTNTGGDATQDVFSVTVTDSDGDSANAPLVIDIVDDVPTAADDAASPAEDTPVVIDVFANDVAGADGVDLAAGVALATGPAKGAVVYNGDGTFTYTPTPGEEGSDSFTYTITDGDGDTSTATVTIALADDSTPTIDVVEAQGGAVVDEAGLPAGSDAAADSETTTGTFAITTGNDAVGSLVIDGVDVTGGGTVTGNHGTLTVTVSGGAYSYSYTLATRTDGDATQDVFSVTVTDSDGDSANAPLVIDIVDDVPTARADADSVTEDGPLTADGNVLTGSGGTDANATDGVADTQGADGAVVTTTGSIPGQHGTLVLNADGSYTYTLDGADTAVQGLSAGETLTEIFNYTIEDGDGDTSSATLTITINGTDDGVTITGLDAAGAEEVVYEDDLGDGSSPDAAALTQTGTFGFSSPDGLDDVTVGGTQVVTNGVFTAGLTASSALGTVTITGFTPVLGADGSVIGGTFSYSYTLDDNTLTHSGAGKDGVTDSFAVTVTDTDGSNAAASLDVRVIDDVPAAQADTNSVAEGGMVAGNVLGNDKFGADGAAPGGAVTGVAAGSDTSTAITGGLGGAIAGVYGSLTLNADGSYTYVGTPNTVPPAGATDTFVYTITDGDGDTSTVTLKIDLTDSGLAAVDNDALVNEAGLASGSDAAANSEVFNGAIAPSGGTGPYTYALTSPAGGAYGNLVLNADGTYTYTLDTAYDGTTADNAANTEQDRDSFSYTVTDANGNVTGGTILVDIVDDVPTATDDAASPAEDTPVVIDVFANDVPGADGVDLVAGVALASGPAKGTVVYNGDGTFTYTPTPGAEGSDSFTYTITDGDGDASTATVTITLAADSTPTLSVTDGVVDEAALTYGSNPASNAETTTGSFTIATGNDSIGLLMVGGENVTGGGVVVGTYGTLTVTLSSGVYNYSYTLDDNTLDHPDDTTTGSSEGIFDSFTVVLTDSDGDVVNDTLTIGVLDDGPTAHANTNSVAEGGVVGGNVLTDGTADVLGADGAAVGGAVTGVGAGSNASSSVAGGVGVAIVGTYGTLTLNANGSYTYNGIPNTVPPAGATDTFVYTITDGDGDTSTTTLTIDLIDSGLAASNEDATVDEAALAIGSNPLSDAETVTGTLADNVSGGTGPYTFALVGGGGGSHGTLTLAANGNWSYTLATPVDGTTADDSTNTVNDAETFTYEVTDGHGNTTTNTLTIDIIDDVPTAADDGSLAAPIAVAEDTAAQIDVFGNDVAGADGVTLGAIALGTPATGGTAVYNGDGTFTYTPNAGFAGADSFTYTITDGDGDTSTATVYVEVAADSVPRPAAAVAAVDDDGLAGGNAGADGATDLDADAGDTGAGLGDEAVFVGTFTADFGNDGPHATDAFTLAGMHGAAGTVGTDDVDYSWDGGTSTLTATIDGGPRDGTNLFTVAVDPVTGQYTVTLLASVAHAAGGAENDATAVLTFTATDSEGDQTPGTLTITFDDDVPTAADDANSVTEGLGNATAGNVFGAGGASAGDAADAIGADGAAAGGAVTGVRTGTEAGGGALTAVGAATVINGTYGDLTINPDGTYSYQLTTASIPPGVTSETFTYQITDGDGDTDVAELVIALNQDANVPDAVGDAQTVYEDGLADGAQHGADSETVTGTFTVDGNGEGYTLTLEGDAGGPVTIDSVGDTVTTSKGVLEITSISAPDAGGVVTYGYSYTLSGALTHTGQGEVNPLSDTITMAVTDATGDSDATPGSIVISIVDDVPVEVAPDAITSGLINAAGSTVTADLDADGNVGDNFGADGPGLITFANVTNGEDSGLTSGGSTITQWLSNDGQTLQGRINSTDGSDGTLVFQIDLDQGASTYTVTMSGSIDNGAGVSFNNLTSVKSGSDDYRGVGADDAPTTVDLLISGSSSSGADAKVNTSAKGIGVGEQSIGPGETVRIDFVSDLTTGAATPTGFDYAGHVSTNSFIGLASQVQSPGSTKWTSFKVWALDTTATSSDVPDRSPAASPGEPFSDSSAMTIIEVTVTEGATGNTTTVDISGLPVTGAKYVAYGVGVIRNSDGSISFTGVQEGYSFGFRTASGDEFDAIAVQGIENNFDLGTFSIGTVVTGDPVQLSYDLQITDGDGDSVLIPDALDITVTANAVPPVALDLDGDGVEFLGLEAGVAHDYGDGLKATAWVSPDDGLLARDTGSGLDIVFTDDVAGATTDLEGVRLGYDSDGDGLLTANDNDWGSFGVWQDANSDGKVDAGEFTALSDAGIASIGLVSDGQSYSAAGGDVLVQGTATFTRADGSRGDVADALFATGEQKAAQRTAEAVATAAAAGALLMPQPVLAHDQIAKADEPLQRIDPRLLETDGPDRVPSADDLVLPPTSDLLGAEKQQQDQGAERSVEHSAGDHAPPALDAEPATGPGADALGSASEPVADLGGSAFAGFGGDAGGGAIMDALLALQAAPAQPAASVDAAVTEALSEVAGGAAVDAIVDHYADGESAGPASSGGEIDPAVLLQALDGHVLAGNGMVIPDPTDDAAMLAAAVPA